MENKGVCVFLNKEYILELFNRGYSIDFIVSKIYKLEMRGNVPAKKIGSFLLIQKRKSKGEIRKEVENIIFDKVANRNTEYLTSGIPCKI